MRRRFFVESFEGRAATLRGDAAHHLGRVLRAEPGQVYELSDGTSAWVARVEQASRDAVQFVLLERVPVSAASLDVTLLLSIVKFDRFEWSLEKATELGVTQIVPLAAARSEKSLVAAAAKRAARWQKILVESAQQARRLRPPLLLPAEKPARAFAAARSAGAGLALLLSERREAPALRRVLDGRRSRSVTLAIGPEGGWTEAEFSAALAAGFVEASLSANILRTETAVVAALASVGFALAE